METIWTRDVDVAPREPLPGDIRVQTAVIGGGIAGVLAAYFLTQAGVDCALIEAKRLFSGVTRGTTAKVTCQHDACYGPLLQALGQERTAMVATANQEAVTAYHDLIAKEGIDCAWQDLPTYLYAKGTPVSLEQEWQAMQALGFEGELVEDTCLPFSVRAALRMDGQAVFHPLRFLAPLTAKLKVYEQTRARAIEGHTVVTDRGRVEAEHIVVATHFPFIDMPGFYFMRMHQDRSYVVALAGAGNLDGAYLGIEPDGFSLRPHENLVLLGGQGHRTGKPPAQGCFGPLAQAATRFFPACAEVCRYSAQDGMPHDGLPFIGPYSRTWPHVYVAAGFGKWGMTTAMAAARILCGQITGAPLAYGAVFTPQRGLSSRALKPMLIDGAQYLGSLAHSALIKPSHPLTSLKVGEGAVVDHQGRKVAAFREREDVVHVVSARCPHKGCQLAWNPDTLIWECPCHGSRFDTMGQVMGNPAIESLPYEEVRL